MLALAAFIVGASATDGKLSQLPTEIELRKCRKCARWRACNLGLASRKVEVGKPGALRAAREVPDKGGAVLLINYEEQAILP